MHSNHSRHYRWHDHLLMGILTCLRIPQTQPSSVPNPSDGITDNPLSPQQMQLSGALMRINHTGEVCAQALYLGQSLTAKKSQIRDAFTLAAQEETLHLQWCEKRIEELNTHQSYLNPLWFTGALFVGTFAGLLGDKWSLGFLGETENQVFEHLGDHLKKLPPLDLKSRAIVTQMQIDEAKHANTAFDLGGSPLPTPIKLIMKGMAQIMKNMTYYV